MYRQALIFVNMFEEFRDTETLFPYAGLGWVTPVGYSTGTGLLLLNRIACVLVGIGLRTRTATFLLFLTFTYTFVLCESNRIVVRHSNLRTTGWFACHCAAGK